MLKRTLKRLLLAAIAVVTIYGGITGWEAIGDSYLGMVEVGGKTQQWVCEEKLHLFESTGPGFDTSSYHELIFVGHNQRRYRMWWASIGTRLGGEINLPLYSISDGSVSQLVHNPELGDGAWQKIPSLPEDAEIVRKRAQNTIWNQHEEGMFCFVIHRIPK